MRKLTILILLVLFSIDLPAGDDEVPGFFEGWKLHGLANIIPYLDGRDFQHNTYMR